MSASYNPPGWDPTAQHTGFMDFADAEIDRKFNTLYGTASTRANAAADPVTGGLTEVQYGTNKRGTAIGDSGGSETYTWIGPGNFIEPRDDEHAELLGHNDPANWESTPRSDYDNLVIDDAALDPLNMYGSEQAFGNINWANIEKKDLPATVLNASQYYDDKNAYAGLLAFRDAYGLAEGAYDGALSASDQARDISLRNAQGDWNRQSRGTSAAMGRRGLGGSTISESYGMSGDLANLTTQGDISAGFAAQRAELEVSQANALVGLLTGQNIGGGGLDPNSAFSMMGQYGSSGAGQANPDLGTSGAGAAIGGIGGYMFGGPIGAMAGAYVGDAIEGWF